MRVRNRFPAKPRSKTNPRLEKAIEKVVGVLVGPKRLQQAEDLVLVVAAARHTPGKEWQFASLQLVEYVNENGINHR